MKPLIRAERLTRYFGSHAVVRDLDLDVPHGKVTALLGLNGAGKTTTIRMLVGLLWPTRGRCWTLGRDSRDLRAEDLSRIGYMVEGHYLYSWMRVGEVQRFAAEGHPRWDSLLTQLAIAAAIALLSVSPARHAFEILSNQPPAG